MKQYKYSTTIKTHKERKPLRPSKEAFDYDVGMVSGLEGISGQPGGAHQNAHGGHGRHGTNASAM